MTNSLIPYSFIPGTKAKAQEINENFIALANQITENKEYTDSKIEDVRTSVTEDRADKKLVNTSLITNCVLEAPNGIVTYTGNTLTVKSGLKVLIPNGRNPDGSYKSIQRTLSQDKLLTGIKNNTVSVVFVGQNSVDTVSAIQFGSKTPPYSLGIWYNPVENKTYKYNTNTSEWELFPCCVVASYENPENTVKNVRENFAVGLLKENDISSILTFGLPDYKEKVSKAAATNHMAPINGYVLATVETQQNQNKYLTIQGFEMKVSHHAQGHIGWDSLLAPVSKGETYSLSGGTNTLLYFIPTKGGF